MCKYCSAVARLQLKPRRLCQLAFASSVLSQFSGGWVERSDTKNDRVEIGGFFDVGAAARHQKRLPSYITFSMVESIALRLLLMMVNASVAAHACVRSCASFDVTEEREASAIVFFLRPM